MLIYSIVILTNFRNFRKRFRIKCAVKNIVVIPLTHHKNSGYTELKVLGVWRSIILLFTAFLVGVLKG